MFEQVNRSEWLRWTLVFVVLALAIAYLNRNYAAESVIFASHHLALAQSFAGVGEREVTTYPLWGYALMISALGSGWGLQIFQAVASSATLALFLLVLRAAFPGRPRLLAALLIAALPWYFMHSVRWPASPAATLLLGAALALLYSCETRRIGWAALGGVLLGLSFNLRPDKLLLPLALVAAWLLSRFVARSASTSPSSTSPSSRASTGLDLRALLLFACASWAVMLPWTLHYRAATGHASMTSSNGGMVAFLSLGQLPDNPWGIVNHDSYARKVLEASGVTAQPWSDTGHQLLAERFQQNVRRDPGAYARKFLWNLRSMLLAGFYLGDSQLEGNQRVQLDVMRERVKLALGVNPNHYEIEQYKELGVWDDPQFSSETLARMAWQVVGTGLGALFMLVALLGMITTPRRILREPLLGVCACVVVYQIVLVGALQYSPRHMNGVFAFLIPFFLIAIERATALAGRLGLRAVR